VSPTASSSSPKEHIPRAYNSTAAQGNVLEVLNMALNVFEKYFIDRGYDRTGRLSIVLSPGQGYFEVDRDLTNITKQRTIDCGCSSELVCTMPYISDCPGYPLHYPEPSIHYPLIPGLPVFTPKKNIKIILFFSFFFLVEFFWTLTQEMSFFK